MANIALTNLFNSFYSANQSIRSFFASFFSSVAFRIYVVANILIVSLVWLVGYIINLKTGSNDFISLNYNVDFGVNLIGPSSTVYKLPSIGSAIFFSNLIIVSFTYKKSKFISHLLFIASVLANAVLLISIIMVYFINFR